MNATTKPTSTPPPKKKVSEMTPTELKQRGLEILQELDEHLSGSSLSEPVLPGVDAKLKLAHAFLDAAQRF